MCYVIENEDNGTRITTEWVAQRVNVPTYIAELFLSKLEKDLVTEWLPSIGARLVERRPDGAVIDAEGCLWNAQWGSARLARYSPDGELLTVVPLPTAHTSCPAFGGKAYDRLFVTSARQNLTPEQLGDDPLAGKTFVIDGTGCGRPEPAVQI